MNAEGWQRTCPEDLPLIHDTVLCRTKDNHLEIATSEGLDWRVNRIDRNGVRYSVLLPLDYYVLWHYLPSDP